MIKIDKFKTLVVFGLGVTGAAVLRAAAVNPELTVYACDDNPSTLDKFRSEFTSVHFVPINQINWQNVDALILSPGVPLYYPSPHPVVQLARTNPRCIISVDIELLWQAEHSNADFIVITGSNGKSTTTKLIYDILFLAGIDVEMGGNIGLPAMSCLPGKGAYILELSSFQLDLLNEAHFDYAVCLNITPDHLDRYSCVADYAKSKQRIFKGSNRSFLGVDSPLTRELYESSPGSFVPFSSRSQLECGVYLKQDMIFYNGGAINIGERSSLLGRHNEENICAAAAVALSMGIGPEIIKESIINFVPLPHRAQLVRRIGNISFVNDSKATNPLSMCYALDCYQGKKIFLILGGREKYNNSLHDSRDYLRGIAGAYLIGEASSSFVNALVGVAPYVECDTLQVALNAAYKDALNSGDESVVLLSPACSSFDQWKNFEARGNAFIDMVMKL